MAMGNSDKETCMVDCSVGAIVWVRRRNGSWWPGKILGPDELSDAHLMSPRSGTPVKLLGREDASVDWYNLEKSKRVKAFRCGEFDDCIERAESSLGTAPKKREKYARREDAILHALELEKQMLEKKNSELVFSSAGKNSKALVTVKNELVTLLEGSSYDEDLCAELHSKKINSSLKGKSFDSSLYVQKVKEVNEDTSVTPRMRGLQDLGPRIATSKQKLSTSLSLNGSRKPVNTVSKSYLSKRRTSLELMTTESVVRRRDRRRPLVQVLRSSAESPVQQSLQYDNDTVSVSMSLENHTKKSKYWLGESSDCLDDKQICPNQMLPTKLEVSCPQPAEENNSESTENTETDCSETDDSLHSNADEKRVELSDVAVVTEIEPKFPRRSVMRIQHGEPENLALSSDTTNLCPGDTLSASMGVSKWKMKGKRNNRSLAKRSTDINGRRVLRDSMEGTNDEEKEIKDCDLIENKSSIGMRSFDKRGTSQPASKVFDDTKQEIINWNGETVMKGYLDPVRDSFLGRMKSKVLFDVEVNVQSIYQREHVPMISLMSKLNGKAIVGHPIQIESLENGSSEILLSQADGVFPDTSLPSMWKTARRTAKFRIPREEIVDHFQFPDQDKNILVPKMDRKYSRRPPKKIRLSCGQKIKTLSSIGMEKKLANNNHESSGLIQGVSSPTALACIPVKLVFSRLYEELVGGHQ